MKINKKIIVGAIFFILIIAIGLYFYFYNGLSILVIAKVGNKKISLLDYQKNINAGLNYYNLQKKAGLLKDDDLKNEQKYKDNLEISVLQQMIENKIVELALIDNFNYDSKNLNKISEAKINQVLSENKDLSKNAEALYNLKLEDFKKLILRPAALKEILNEELKKKGEKYINAWFLEQSKKYNIEIYFKDLKWNKELGIVERK